MSLLAIWGISALLASPLLLAMDLKVIELPKSVLDVIGVPYTAYCIENWGEYSKGRLLYSIFALLVQFILPLTLISLAHNAIKKKLQKLPSWKKATTEIKNKPEQNEDETKVPSVSNKVSVRYIRLSCKSSREDGNSLCFLLGNRIQTKHFWNSIEILFCKQIPRIDFGRNIPRMQKLVLCCICIYRMITWLHYGRAGFSFRNHRPISRTMVQEIAFVLFHLLAH